MSYTPVELRHVRVSRSLLGYRPSAVQELLAEVAESFETVWRERHELADQIESLETQLDDLRQRERALAQTLLAAEQAANDIREQAKREGELIVAEAHAEARSVTRTAHGDHERLRAEARRVESLLRGALGMIEEAAAAGEEGGWPAEEEAQPELQQVSGGYGWGQSG
jgi:cell division initiation protein